MDRKNQYVSKAESINLENKTKTADRSSKFEYKFSNHLLPIGITFILASWIILCLKSQLFVRESISASIIIMSMLFFNRSQN